MLKDLLKIGLTLGIICSCLYTPSVVSQFSQEVVSGVKHQVTHVAQAQHTPLLKEALGLIASRLPDAHAHKPPHQGGQDVLDLSHPEIQVQLDPSSKALAVDAIMNDQVAGRFIVDTGATYTAITSDTADALGVDTSHAQRIPIMTASGRIFVPKVTLAVLRLGSLVAHDVEVTVLPVRQTPQFSGLLGLNFTNRYIMTVDPTQSRLIFKPRQDVTE
ncbi:MAG: TIGR02281 family clan AA aspartic protease [Vampirovibrionales bacterium]